MDDRERFRTLAAPLLDRLHFAALRLARNPTVADDLAQEALLEAWRDFGGFDASRPFAPWLFRILETTFLDSRRKRRIDAAPLESDPAAPEPAEAAPDPAEPEALRRCLDDRMLEALDRLPEEQRMAVLYADVFDLPYAEIAAIQGAPVGTIRFRIHAGRKRLRVLLSERRPA